MNNPSEVEILLVEDNAHDAELAMRALKKPEFRFGSQHTALLSASYDRA